MESIIKAAVERGASDIHIKAGDVFRARIGGELRPLTKQRLTPEQTKSIALKVIPTEEDRQRIDRIRDYDCSWGAPGIGRFRVSILRQRSSFMIVMRVVPFEVPTLEKLHLPRSIQTIAESERGLVLVTGPTGCGKSSTVAAMIHHINTNLNRHIVMIEEPIEFLHRDLKSSVTQREIGPDTASYHVGLRATLRQDPDVVMLAELHDSESVDMVLNAAETGRLVISTMPTTGVTNTLARLTAVFPPEEHELVRMRLADTLQAVVSQRLLPRQDGKGRCAAVEVLICTPEVRSMIADRSRVGDIEGYMADSRDQLGMQTFDQHLADLVDGDVVSLETAQAASPNPEKFAASVERVTKARPRAGQAEKENK